MKKHVFILSLSFISCFSFSQNRTAIDSFMHHFYVTKSDAQKVELLVNISLEYRLGELDSAIYYGKKALKLAKKINDPTSEILAYSVLMPPNIDLGNLSEALSLGHKALAIAHANHLESQALIAFNYMGLIYVRLKNYKKAVLFYKQQKKYALGHQHTGLAYADTDLGYAYLKMNALDSARTCIQLAQIQFAKGSVIEPMMYGTLGEIEVQSGRNNKALECFHYGLNQAIENKIKRSIAELSYHLAYFYHKLNQLDSSEFYAKKCLTMATVLKRQTSILESSSLLATLYESRDLSLAYRYLKLAKKASDQLYGPEKMLVLQNLIANNQERELKATQRKITAQNKQRQILLLVGLSVVALIGFALYINNRQKQKANVILAKINQDLQQSRTLLEHKNRDLEIEAALDKVRTRSLAMHHSDELSSVVNTLFKQLGSLKLPVTSTWVSLVKVQEEAMEIWTTHGDKFAEPIKVKASDYNNFKQEIEAWKNNLALINLPTPKESAIRDIKKFFNIDLKDEKDAAAFHILNVRHQQGYIGMGSWQPADEKEINILKRFAAVFEQTYTRFLDLQKAEKQVEQAKLDFIQIQTEKKRAEDALTELKITQAQLIQSEKLASLGELTAGIAHEIQNPLNFVNNFAEVSAEMLDEMHEELEKGDTAEAIAIATGLKTNLEKINHHGQRASSIVKGMLEHSRASTGVKEPTDLNALADEYLRLAYHGLRAKDNNFNAAMETHFDPNLPKVSVIPQDIGRVLLNLINNAFYAVQLRATTVETLHATSLQHPPYQPTVTISTQKTDDQIIIKVQDNGNGIPEAIRDKIFQPFFTTKPTGQGTGLGLSLAYDIVTKGHGGVLEVQSQDGVGTTFIISLPINDL